MSFLLKLIIIKNMERKIIQKLINWKKNKNKKPLIISGARQIGKTWVMKHFGKNFYKNYIYLNFEKNEKLNDIFTSAQDVQAILKALSIYSNTEITEETLIIFDEIGENLNALTSLKYFYEFLPQYHIISAGSLLGVAINHQKSSTSFPIGKVDFLKMYPLSFLEFLEAIGKNRYKKLINDLDFKNITLFKTDFEELLREYLFVGGMPEAVDSFARNHNFDDVRKIQNALITGFTNDFSKYNTAFDTLKTKMIWESIPSQLSKDNSKYIFKYLKKGARASDFLTAISWLKNSGLVYSVHNITKPSPPISSYTDNDAFKLYFFDVGILCSMLNVPPKILLEDIKIFTEFKGILMEQYVLQELKNIGLNPLYWANNTAEVDFITELEGEIVPLEVKAGINLKAKSLTSYINKYAPEKVARSSLADFKISPPIYDIPLYIISEYCNILMNK
ncbi:MAG: ATP-binding protein [Treponema sp.]